MNYDPNYATPTAGANMGSQQAQSMANLARQQVLAGVDAAQAQANSGILATANNRSMLPPRSDSGGDGADAWRRKGRRRQPMISSEPSKLDLKQETEA